jgi:hypothetical protein
VLVLKTLRGLALTAAFGVFVVIGCGGDDKDGGTGLPPRNSGKEDGGQTNTSSSSGTTSSSGDPTYDCSNHAAVDTNPQCDQCARAKCCEWITKCDGAPSCKQAQECLAACASDDILCISGCGATGGSGGTFLQEFGACVNNSCKSECASAQPNLDAGQDAPF